MNGDWCKYEWVASGCGKFELGVTFKSAKSLSSAILTSPTFIMFLFWNCKLKSSLGASSLGPIYIFRDVTLNITPAPALSDFTAAITKYSLLAVMATPTDTC